ncbi:MAG: AMP-binding protein [Balneolaceae bacterium]|nr:AMP-binding protein [Balneolaceae bacterium]
MQDSFNISENKLDQDIVVTNTKKLSLNSYKDLKKAIQRESSTAEIKLYTSGTTGQPKGVDHNLKTLLKRIHIDDKHKDDVWGFAYNPTHMAGIQVFFQAFLNKNSIVRLFELDRSKIFTSINKYKVSHISATPTFYRLLLSKNEQFPNVIRLTMGGEGHGKKLENKLQKLFPNAEMRNIYASTEAGALFETTGEIFTIEDSLREKIKIEEDELILHRSLLAESMRKKVKEGWYNTGDLVEVVQKSPLQFRFKGRKNEMINVGGYKVNPNKVENVINEIRGVISSRVFSKDNRVVGKIVCCEVVIEDNGLDEKEIRNVLKKRLNDYEIPRFFEFVDTVKKTNTGKIQRNG